MSTFPPGKRSASIWGAWEVKDIIAMLAGCNVTLLKRAAITPIDIEGWRYIPVDVDVSTLDNGKSHKELGLSHPVLFRLDSGMLSS